MRWFCKTILWLTWGLWFGGVMGLFLSVQVLFHQTGRSVFLESAPRLFLAFEKYQLILAGIALLLTVTLRKTHLFLLFVIAAAGAIVETVSITPRIEVLRIQGATHTPQFLRLHGLSMGIYMLIAITLLIAGILQSYSLDGLRRAKDRI